MSHGRERELNFKLMETGAEIPADVLSKIFDRPFNTIEKPTPQNPESNVMSLSGVYDIVGMHGGRVFVNSSAEKGATFLFTLPAITAEAEENSHEQAVNSSRRRR
jgi:signal transduction histidine kinase